MLIRAAPLLLVLAASGAAGANGLMDVSNGSYNPFTGMMDMMVDAMESYGRDRAFEDTLESYAWQTQPWSWGGMGTQMPGMGTAIPGMGMGMPGIGTGIPGMGTQIPGQTQMQQMWQRAPGTAGSLGGLAGRMYAPRTGALGAAPVYPGGGGPSVPFAGAGAGSSLNGAWQGRSGEILVVRDGHFRIYAGPDTYTDGRIIVQGNQLALANTSTGSSRRYEFALHEGRLALQDTEGNVLLYRRASPEVVRALIP